MRTLLALSVPLSLIAACEASRPPAPAAPTPPRPPASASAPAASASAAAVRSAPVPVSLAPVDDDPLAPLPRGAISRGGTTRMRTVRDTESVAVSDDGRSVWAVERGSSGDCVVRDLGRGSTLFTLQSCREPVLAHDGSFVVANVDKATGEIALFRTSDGQRLRGTNVPLPTVVTKFLKRAMTGRAVVESIHVSGDDKRVAVVTSAGKVHVIDAESGKLIASHALDGRLVGLDRTGARALAVRRTTGFFSLDPQGWFVVDLGSGRVLRKIDPKPESTAISTAAAPGPSARASVALAWDGRSVLAKEGNTLWSVDIETGNATELWRRESSTFDFLSSLGRVSLTATPSGGAAWIGNDGTVEWKPGSGSPSPLGHGTPVAFSPSGSVAALSANRAIELSGGDPPSVPQGHSKRVSSLAFLGGGTVLASGANDLRMWQVPTSKPLASSSNHGEVRGLTASADGTSLVLQGSKLRVVSASGRVETIDAGPFPGRVDIDATGRRLVYARRDLETGTELTMAIHGVVKARTRLSGEARSLSFSPGGERIGVFEEPSERGGGPSRLVLRDAATLEVRDTYDSPALSKMDEFVFAGSDQRVIGYGMGRGAALVDLEARKTLRHFSWPSCCDVVATSRDGRLVAGSSKESIVVWETETRKLLGTLSGHRGEVTALAFSPDGRVLASGSEDTTVLLWDVSRAEVPPAGLTPVAVSGPSGAEKLSSYGAPELYVTPEGRVGRWSDGRGAVPKLGGVKEIATGLFASCALRDDGKVSCWGWTGRGVLGIPEQRVNRQITQRDQPVVVPGVTEGRVLRLASDYACVLTTRGRVVCWGTPSGATIAPALTAPREVAGVTDAGSIAVGPSVACAAKADGTVSCWGGGQKEPFPAPTVPEAVAGVADATALTAGSDHVCALRRDGSVQCWGDNEYDQLGDGTGLDSVAPVAVRGVPPAVQIEAAGSLTCARTGAGAIWCWGRRAYGSAPGFSEPAEVVELRGATSLRVSGLLVCADGSAGLRCLQMR